MSKNIAFISDLHLDSKYPDITERWNHFYNWAFRNIKELYILGDFFAAWAGDDLADKFANNIASQIKNMVNAGINVYFLPGNRDFLLGDSFAKKAGWQVLPQQKLISILDKKLLLIHGDELCTGDVSHQIFRKLTRNKLFKTIFLFLPKSIRKNIVKKVRAASSIKSLPDYKFLTSDKKKLEFYKKYKADIIVHGHIHKSSISTQIINSEKKITYILSDWDDKPMFLMYNVSTKSFNLQR